MYPSVWHRREGCNQPNSIAEFPVLKKLLVGVYLIMFHFGFPERLETAKLPPLNNTLWQQQKRFSIRCIEIKEGKEPSRWRHRLVDKNITPRQPMRIINGSRENVSCGALKLIQFGKYEK